MGLGVTDRFVGLVRAALGLTDSPVPSIMRLGRYRCTVTAQNADGTVDLTPDDTRISAEKNVVVHVSPPGASWQVQPGAIAWMGWTGGDPSKPYCTPDYEAGAVVTKLVLKANMVFVGDEPGAKALVSKDDFDAHVHTGPSTTCANGAAWTGSTAPPTTPATGTTKMKAV
jgi:hypothetical protein